MVEVQVLASWLTPTSLFVVLNIVLATIFINHNSKNNHHNNHHSTTTDDTTPTTTTTTHSQPHPQLMRAPSLFSRVASFNFSHYYHSHQDSHNMSPPPDTAASVVAPPVVETITRAPSLLFRVASFKLGWTSPPLEQVEHANASDNEKRVAREGHVRREKAVEEEVKVKVVNKKKKVVKKKEKMGADVAKLEKKTTAFKEEEEEVDTKADDFINKFKQQLKMQRLESLLRYRNATPSA